MSSIAAIDPRCFVSPPAAQAQPAPHAPPQPRAPRRSFLMTRRPPLGPAKTRA